MNIKLNQEELNLLIESVSFIKEATYDDIIDDLGNFESKYFDNYYINEVKDHFTLYCSLYDLKTKLCNYSIEEQNNSIELEEEI